jgi:pantothenate synthetase
MGPQRLNHLGKFPRKDNHDITAYLATNASVVFADNHDVIVYNQTGATRSYKSNHDLKETLCSLINFDYSNMSPEACS